MEMPRNDDKRKSELDHDFDMRRYKAAIHRVRCADQRLRDWRGSRDYVQVLRILLCIAPGNFGIMIPE